MKIRSGIFGFALAALAGCSVGPNYHRPAALKSQPLPAAFENVTTNSTNTVEWKVAEPSAHLPRGEWWKTFDDAELDRLETLATADNQDLAAAVARFDEARAQVGAARADFYPQLALQPGATRQRTSFNTPVKGTAADTSYTYNTFSVPLDLNWELDLFGRIRRQSEAARANFVASADDVESVRVALQAEVAADYFSLRALDAERKLVADTVETYRRSLELTQNRRKGGIVSDLDVSQAETQLRSTEAEVPALDLQRANLLHALATLCGQPATGFHLDPAPLADVAPKVPVSIPSELLERRPDVAAAERRMAAANADIGVAKSAFYPRVFLSGAAGFQSVGTDTLFDWPSRLWSLGPSVTLPIFTGGRNRAQLAVARARYDQTVAAYRQSVLTAFQEVEDQLAARNLVAEQLTAHSAALAASQRTLAIANNRYKAGLVTYLEVASAQNVALENERAVVQLEGQRLMAEVGLVRALGGGWEGNSPKAVAQANSK